MLNKRHDVPLVATSSSSRTFQKPFSMPDNHFPILVSVMLRMVIADTTLIAEPIVALTFDPCIIPIPKPRTESSTDTNEATDCFEVMDPPTLPRTEVVDSTLLFTLFPSKFRAPLNAVLWTPLTPWLLSLETMVWLATCLVGFPDGAPRVMTSWVFRSLVSSLDNSSNGVPGPFCKSSNICNDFYHFSLHTPCGSPSLFPCVINAIPKTRTQTCDNLVISVGKRNKLRLLIY